MELKVTRPVNGFAPSHAAEAIHASGLVHLFEDRAQGPFGMSALAVDTLEALVEAADISLAAAEALRGLVLDELRASVSPSSFALPELQAPHRQLVRAFPVRVRMST